MEFPNVVNTNIVFHIYVYFLQTLVKPWFPKSLYVLNVYVILHILYCRLSVIAYYLYVECLFRSINTYFLKVKGITLNTSKLQVRCLIFLILPRSGFVNKKKTTEVFVNSASNTHPQISLILFVSLFVWGLSSYSRIFHLYGDVIIASEWLQIFNSARHSWPLSKEGSSECHTYCVIIIYNGHLRGLWHSHLLPSV